ncbi:MAG: hypothetical protein HFF71_08650 [Oscillospiraceae bacterium]|nr:hypothetical protein [Oscillospiraceae bacterium]
MLLWLSLLPGQALAADEPIPVDPPVIEEPAEPEEPPVMPLLLGETDRGDATID